jgi:hypothetical protein
MSPSRNRAEELAKLAQAARHVAVWLAQTHRLPSNGDISRVMAFAAASGEALGAVAYLRKHPLLNVPMGVVSPHISSVALLRDAFDVVWREGGYREGDPLGMFGGEGCHRHGQGGAPIATPEAIHRLAEAAAFVQADAEALGAMTSGGKKGEFRGGQKEERKHSLSLRRVAAIWRLHYHKERGDFPVQGNQFIGRGSPPRARERRTA